MKKLLCLAAVTSAALLYSCKSDTADIPEPSALQLLSPKRGEVFAAGTPITIDWKSISLTKDSRIIAKLINESPDGIGHGQWLGSSGSLVISIEGEEIPTTLNDGSEVFYLPGPTNTSLYDSYEGGFHFTYGNTFYIQIVSIMPEEGKWVYKHSNAIKRGEGRITIKEKI